MGGNRNGQERPCTRLTQRTELRSAAEPQSEKEGPQHHGERNCPAVHSNGRNPIQPNAPMRLGGSSGDPTVSVRYNAGGRSSALENSDVVARSPSHDLTPGTSEATAVVGRTPAAFAPGSSRNSGKITLFTDNMNTMTWIQKGRAKSYFANKLLSELFDHLPPGVGLEVVWVQSANNPADFPSRHPHRYPP